MWIIALLGVVFVVGSGLKLYGSGETSGRAQCKAEIAAADARLAAKSDELKQEATNHIDDMVTAFEDGEKNAKIRVVTVRSKASADVAAFPVFKNPACVLPSESLRNLNTARASLRVETQAPAPSGTPQPPSAPESVLAPIAGHPEPSTPAPAAAPAPAERRPLGKRP